MTPPNPASNGLPPHPAGASLVDLLGHADGLSGFDLAGLARADQRRRWLRGEPVPDYQKSMIANLDARGGPGPELAVPVRIVDHGRAR